MDLVTFQRISRRVEREDGRGVQRMGYREVGSSVLIYWFCMDKGLTGEPKFKK